MTPYERLQSICEQNGTTVTGFCFELKKSKGNLTTWKKGNFSVSDLKAIRDKFNVSIDWLLFGSSLENTTVLSTQSNIIASDDIDSTLIQNYGSDYLEKIYKELNEKQKVFVITWLIGYAKNQGINIRG